MTLAVEGLKFCPKCGETKPVEEFHRNRQNSDGLHGWCAKCHNAAGCAAAKANPGRHVERSRRWRAANRDRYREIARNANRKKLYGVSAKQFDEMVKAQQGRCAACGQPETWMRHGKVMNLSVDHCHRTGQVRALLCGACNSALGQAGDDPARLHLLAEYLETKGT